MSDVEAQSAPQPDGGTAPALRGGASSAEPKSAQPSSQLWKLALGALGVVYGDIGTSPLYAVRECFDPAHGLAPTPANVLGILSLITWALILVVVIKYLWFVLQADNHGEGGILALLALVEGSTTNTGPSRRRMTLVLMGLFGASLLYADGIITPAISVLGAVEGLRVATPVFEHWVVPISAAILIALFLIQKRGTGGIGAIFGPATLLWFLAIAAAGLPWIARVPEVLTALHPGHAVSFMVDHGMHGFLLLGSVVLVVTGAEALYADMGHFGR